MKKFIIIPLLMIAVAFSAGCIRRERTLDKVIREIETLGSQLETLTAEVEQIALVDGEETTSTYTLWYSKGRYRMEWGESGGRQVEIYDGNNAWTFVEGENNIFLIRDLEKEDIFAYLANFQQQFTVSYKDSVTIDGIEAHVLEGTMETAPGYTLTWWVDKKTGFPFKSENRSEQWTATWQYRNYQINTDLEESLFFFIPPSGSNIIHVPQNP
jgi:outer membrane lipoprotein-sorting protein